MRILQHGILYAALTLTIWSCSQSKQEPIVQKLDSSAKAIAEQGKEAVNSTVAVAGATATAVADSIAKAAENAKKAVEEKADEIAEAVKKAHPDAYDPTPVDQEPETDMASLKKAIEYPKEAKDKGIEGRVRVRALIAANGRVVKAFIENSSNKIFDEPAQTAVKKANP
jgi:TonB family protein